MLLFLIKLQINSKNAKALKKIKNALVSVYHKDGLDDIIKTLDNLGITIYSTGGTFKFIEDLGVQPKTVESLTSYPSILGGRVKTLHPKVFGGILGRRELKEDLDQMEQYEIPEIVLLVQSILSSSDHAPIRAQSHDSH